MVGKARGIHPTSLYLLRKLGTTRGIVTGSHTYGNVQYVVYAQTMYPSILWTWPEISIKIGQLLNVIPSLYLGAPDPTPK